jgi:hypothetical protein
VEKKLGGELSKTRANEAPMECVETVVLVLKGEEDQVILQVEDQHSQRVHQPWKDQRSDTEGPRVTDLFGDKGATRTASRASNELILVRRQQMDSHYPCMLGQRLMRQQPPKLQRSD